MTFITPFLITLFWPGWFIHLCVVALLSGSVQQNREWTQSPFSLSNTHTPSSWEDTICRCGAVHRLLLFSPARLLIQEGVWWLRAFSEADATVVTRCLISCLISMATAEADLPVNKMYIKVRACHQFGFIRILSLWGHTDKQTARYLGVYGSAGGGGM